MKVVFYFRRPNDTNWSIESIFLEVSRAISNAVEVSERVSPFYSTGLRNRLRAIQWVRRESRREAASINHITGDVHFLALGLPRRTIVLTVHDLSFVKRGNLISRLVLWLFWIYLPIRLARVVTCVSEETKKDILRFARCSPAKVKVIHNFLRQEFKHNIRPFNKKCPILLQVGTNYNKNLTRLIAALNGLNCELRIIGPVDNGIKKQLVDNGIVYSVTSGLSNQEMLEEYINADVVTFCSTLEGFGLPIIEGQAVGRVVVTSAASSMPEIAGEGACLVDPLNISSIRAGICKVIEDDGYRDELVRKGLRNAERFKLEVVAANYLDIYRMVGGHA